MTNALAPAQQIDPALIERVIIHGDLRQLNPQQKVSYYNAVCESVGLNPLTQPFQYLVLSGREVLYARREATDQLRHLHNVSVHITAREVTEDCYIVTARASLPDGRTDESIGAVPIASLKGEARANALMKAETKAKRRVTLAICGLGMLDETEIESVVEPVRPDFTAVATSIADQYPPPKLYTPVEIVQGGITSLPPEADPDDDARASGEVAVDATAARLARLRPGVVIITKVEAAPTKNPNVVRTTLTVAGGPSWPSNQTRLTTINERLAEKAESAWSRGQAVAITVTKGKFNYELATLEDAPESAAPVGPPPDDAAPAVADRDPSPFD
jgi:hypothetical protein